MKKYIKKNRVKLYTLLVSVLVTFTYSCDDSGDVTDGIREIQFKPSASTALITRGETIKYQDSSLNVTSRVWTFEGGDITTSDQEIVEVTYEEPSLIVDDTPVGFVTTLEVTHDDGKVDYREFKVDVYERVMPNFSADKNAALNGSTIAFTDLSEFTESKWEDSKEEDAYLWTFEGGVPETSTDKNPTVVYPNVGDYSVSLIVYRSAPESVARITKTDFIKIVDVQVIASTSNRLAGFGSKILLDYEADLVATDASKFTLTVDGSESVISSVEIDAASPKTYILNLETPVTDGQSISLSYEGGDFASTGELLGPIVDLGIENTVVNLLSVRNADFEDDGPGGFPSTGWANWDGSSNNFDDYAVIDTDQQNGNHSLEITLDGTTNEFILETGGGHVAVERGMYRMTVWAKSDADGVPLNFRSVTPGWSDFPGSEVNLTTDWAEYSFEFSTEADADDKLFRNYWHVLRPVDQAAGVKVYIDNISLYRID